MLQSKELRSGFVCGHHPDVVCGLLTTQEQHFRTLYTWNTSTSSITLVTRQLHISSYLSSLLQWRVGLLNVAAPVTAEPSYFEVEIAIEKVQYNQKVKQPML